MTLCLNVYSLCDVPFARLEVVKKENPRKKLFEIGMDHASKNNSLHDPDLFSISKYQIFV